MAQPQLVQLHVVGYEEAKEEAGGGESNSTSNSTSTRPSTSTRRRSVKGWVRVGVQASAVIVSQSAAVLLLRLYFVKGGSSKWMGTLIQFCGSPILLPYYLYTKLLPNSNSNNTTITQNGAVSIQPPSSKPNNNTTPTTRILIYVGIGTLNAGCAFLYSIGLQILPVSTATIIAASQLAFLAAFSYLLNSTRFTPLTLNSLFLLTISSLLIVFSPNNNNDNNHDKTSTGKYALGFICTLGSAAGYGLLFSLLEYTFRKVLKLHMFRDVAILLMFQGLVGTALLLVGLFASGDWKGLGEEMDGYELGKASYVMTLVGCAVTSLVFTVGIVGLVYEVSSVFSNVVAAVGVPLTPILAVVFFHDGMDAVKAISMVIAVWGLLSYLYQQYLDDRSSSGGGGRGDGGGGGDQES